MSVEADAEPEVRYDAALNRFGYGLLLGFAIYLRLAAWSPQWSNV